MGTSICLIVLAIGYCLSKGAITIFWLDDTFYIFDEAPNLVAFICDDVADLSNLPTSHHQGTQQGDDNVNLEPVNPGSMAFVISTSEVYRLNSTDSWILQPKRGGGGGGASSLAELTDVSISNPQNDQVIAWDETTQKWINKDMEQVVHVDYANIENPPTINGVALTPTTTLEDLGIAPAPTYDDPTETIGL